MNWQRKITIELSWNQARALAYAADVGIRDGRWPSEEYRLAANEAREILVDVARV